MSNNAENDSKIKNAVREIYGKVADSNTAGQTYGNPKSCCGTSQETDIEYSTSLGYTLEDTKNIPEGANMGLGCGNPISEANLQIGETVLDLGSGGGFDCFLAVKKVGNTGHIIGVDMTPAMITKSRLNAVKSGYSNVEFRLGEIENLPVADNFVDVVISNCVINLSTNKSQVFKEIARVLKSGGRICISDIVVVKELPEKLRNDLEIYAGCMAGAMTIVELKNVLEKVGFGDIRIEIKEASKCFIEKWTSSEIAAENYLSSAIIKAVR